MVDTVTDSLGMWGSDERGGGMKSATKKSPVVDRIGRVCSNMCDMGALSRIVSVPLPPNSGNIGRGDNFLASVILLHDANAIRGRSARRI